MQELSGKNTVWLPLCPFRSSYRTIHPSGLPFQSHCGKLDHATMAENGEFAVASIDFGAVLGAVANMRNKRLITYMLDILE